MKFISSLIKPIKSFFTKNIPILNRTLLEIIIVAGHSCFIGYFMYLTIDIIYSSIFDIYQISISIDRMIVTILFTIIEFLIALKAKGKSISKIALITLHVFIVCILLVGILLIVGLVRPYERIFPFVICAILFPFIDCLILLLASERNFTKLFWWIIQLILLWPFLFFIVSIEIKTIKFIMFFTIIVGTMYALLIKRDLAFVDKGVFAFLANMLIIFLFFVSALLFAIINGDM